MELICTRPHCARPLNIFPDLDNTSVLKTTQQKFCTHCGMPLILAGRYLPQRLLGQGGFGAAFLAKDRYTPAMKSCVVKLFQPASDLNPQQLAVAQSLFEREAEVLEQLGNRHPQIPDLYAFFPLLVNNPQSTKEEQYFYLVQEFVAGEDLEQELAKAGPLSPDQIEVLLRSLLPVLQFVHDHGSIHRDIKPSNIIRTPEGVLFLLDFGAVKQVTAGGGQGLGRSTGIYSPGFAPPEQMAGAQVYPSTDLYALAVTCITLATGQTPEMLFDAYHNTWAWRSAVPRMPDRLAQVLDRMLQATPKDRFASAQEALEALEGGRGTATPPTPPMPSTALQSPTPSSPVVPVTPVASPLSPAVPRFSLLETLANAGFVGFEGAFLGLAFTHLIPHPGIAIGLTGALVGGSIYVLWRRIVEGKDLPIFLVLSVGLMFIPAIHGGAGLQGMIAMGLLCLIAGAIAIAITAFFRLVYQILATLL